MIDKTPRYTHLLIALQAALVLAAALQSSKLAAEANPRLPTAAPPIPETSPKAVLGVDVPAKVLRYLDRRFRQLDANHNGRLEREEWQTLQPSPVAADTNADGILTREELKDRMLDYGRARRVRVLSTREECPENSPAADDSADKEAGAPAADNATDNGSDPPKEPARADASKSKSRRDTRFFVPTPRLPQGIPDWWHDRDTNGDGQLTLREFAPQASSTDIAAFKKLDVNSDGVVTSSEYVRTNSTKKPDAPKPDVPKPVAAKSPAR